MLVSRHYGYPAISIGASSDAAIPPSLARFFGFETPPTQATAVLIALEMQPYQPYLPVSTTETTNEPLVTIMSTYNVMTAV